MNFKHNSGISKIIQFNQSYFVSILYFIIFWRKFNYFNLQTEYIDYDELEKLAVRFKPKMIIAGFSAYSRPLDYDRFRSICDRVGAYLFAGKVLLHKEAQIWTVY